MKNKHNTMNSSSAQKTYIQMQNKILKSPNDYCFLVEVISPVSRNIPWVCSVNGQRCSNEHIRKVSVDKFYQIVTGVEDAFYQMCMVLPSVIQKAVDELEGSIVPHDTVIDELKALAKKQNIDDENLAVAMAVYMLGFGSYNGFVGR